MSNAILGTLKTIRSNFSLGLSCYGVLRSPRTRNAILINRVVLKQDGVFVVPPGCTLPIAPGEQCYEVGLAGSPEMAIERAANEFAKMLLRNFTLDTYEAIWEYCGQTKQRSLMQSQPWYQFARMVRNALTHTQHWRFQSKDLARLPVTWNGKTIDATMNGAELDGDLYDWFDACELWDEVCQFATTLT